MNAPKIPRREQMSVVETAISLLLAVIVMGLIAAATFLWPVVQGLWGRGG